MTPVHQPDPRMRRGFREVQVIGLRKRGWDKARQAHKDARLALNTAIREAAKAGISQAEIARILGWPRQRVSKLLG